MNLSEFKAWFEGFTENLEGPPKEKAWKRIKEKIGKIVETPTPPAVFIKDYYNPWRRWFPHEPYWYCGNASLPQVTTPTFSANTTQGTAAQAVGYNRASLMCANPGGDNATTHQLTFDAGTAFQDLGRAEAASLNR